MGTFGSLREDFKSIRSTGDRWCLADAMKSSALVRMIVHRAVTEHQGEGASRVPIQADLNRAVFRIASRLLDDDDPAVDYLGQAEDAAHFREALGHFVRETVLDVLAGTPAMSKDQATPAERSTNIFILINEEVAAHVVKLKFRTHHRLAARQRAVTLTGG